MPCRASNSPAPRPGAAAVDALRFVCPACKGALAAEDAGYHCARCARDYPVLFGIADFRLRSDRYLTLEAERAKARRLHEFGLTTSFDELVAFYYSITDDVPDDLAVRYRAYLRWAPERGARILADLGPLGGSDSLLDIGCGSGGLLVAARGRFGAVVGVDIALRWLVIGAKRLAEQGVEATLVCADVEALPFAEASTSLVVAADLIESVYDVDAAIAALSRLLVPGGTLWLSAANKYCLGPHPLVRLWAVGFLPRPLRSWLVKAIRGVESLRYVHLVSPMALARRCRAEGFQAPRLAPAPVQTGSLDGYPRVDRILILLYRKAWRLGVMRYFLILFGPAFQMVCRKAPAGARGPAGRRARRRESPARSGP